MFNSLKEKLKNWTKNISKKENPEEDIEIPKKEIKIEKESKKEKISKKPQKIEKNKEEPEPGTESFFKKITSKVNKVKITQEKFDVYAEELELLLLENNVAFEVTEKIIDKLKQEIVGKELLKKEIEEEIKEIFKEIIKEILIEPFDLIDNIKERNKQGKPYVMLFCGINGSGKTTTIAKLTEYLKENKLSCVLAAGDTFRAAAIQQLQKHGEKLNVKVISQDYGSDPAAVGFDAVKYAEKNKINCVLIDTAGRMHTSKDLLKEIEKISRVCKPDCKIFVGEAITGNDAIEQVKTFNWEIGLDGIILTKQDIDEKGGTSLSVGYVTKKPILFLGTGQEYDKIEPFNKEKFLKKLGL